MFALDPTVEITKKTRYSVDWSDPRGTYPVGGGVIDTRYPTPYAVITEGMLKHDAFKIPMDVLQDMWVTRFGNDWVDLETLTNEEFFRIAAERLRSVGRLESHYLTDRARFVCRKAE